jgi:hypothetical protein
VGHVARASVAFVNFDLGRCMPVAVNIIIIFIK